MELNNLPEPQAPAAQYLNTKQAATHLGLSTQYMEIARHKGDGPQYIKLAKAVRYRVEDLDAWMADHIRKHTADVKIGGPVPEPLDQLGHNNEPSLYDAIEQNELQDLPIGHGKRGDENGK